MVKGLSSLLCLSIKGNGQSECAPDVAHALPENNDANPNYTRHGQDAL